MENATFDELLELGDKLNKPGSKTTSTSVSLNQKVKEAQAVAGHERRSSTPGPKTREERIAKTVAAKKQGDQQRAAKVEKYGTSDAGQIRRVEGQGTFDPNFEFLAKTNPEGAQAALDNQRATLGIPRADGTGRAKPERIWEGTHDASDGSGEQVPYFTNLPAGARMEGARDLKRYQASAPASQGLGGDSEPRRALARQLDTADAIVKHTPKSDDVVAREAAKQLPEFLADIKKFGKDEAANRQFAKVAAGSLSDDAYKRMHSESGAEATQADAQEFANTRERYANVARTLSATDALAQIDEDIATQSGNAKHLLAVRREIAQRARPFASNELLTMPDLYYPYSRADVEKVNARRAGASAQEAADTAAASASATLSDTVGNLAGSPARTAASYLGRGGEASAARPAKQSQIVGGAELGYEIGAPFIPESDPNKSGWGFLEGSGTAIGEAIQGANYAAGGRESKSERARRLKREAVKRGRKE